MENKEVSVGQRYKEVGARKGRAVKVESINYGINEATAYIQNILTLRRVKIKIARLLDKSRFELVAEVGSLAPSPMPDMAIAP